MRRSNCGLTKRNILHVGFVETRIRVLKLAIVSAVDYVLVDYAKWVALASVNLLVHWLNLGLPSVMHTSVLRRLLAVNNVGGGSPLPLFQMRVVRWRLIIIG